MTDEQRIRLLEHLVEELKSELNNHTHDGPDHYPTFR